MCVKTCSTWCAQLSAKRDFGTAALCGHSSEGRFMSQTGLMRNERSDCVPRSTDAVNDWMPHSHQLHARLNYQLARQDTHPSSANISRLIKDRSLSQSLQLYGERQFLVWKIVSAVLSDVARQGGKFTHKLSTIRLSSKIFARLEKITCVRCIKARKWHISVVWNTFCEVCYSQMFRKKILALAHTDTLHCLLIFAGGIPQSISLHISSDSVVLEVHPQWVQGNLMQTIWFA